MSRTLHLSELNGSRAVPARAGYLASTRREKLGRVGGRDAGVAHSVERNLAKVEVAGSKPVSRSISSYSNLTRSLPDDGPLNIARQRPYDDRVRWSKAMPAGWARLAPTWRS